MTGSGAGAAGAGFGRAATVVAYGDGGRGYWHDRAPARDHQRHVGGRTRRARSAPSAVVHLPPLGCGRGRARRRRPTRAPRPDSKNFRRWTRRVASRRWRAAAAPSASCGAGSIAEHRGARARHAIATPGARWPVCRRRSCRCTAPTLTRPTHRAMPTCGALWLRDVAAAVPCALSTGEPGYDAAVGVRTPRQSVAARPRRPGDADERRPDDRMARRARHSQTARTVRPRYHRSGAPRRDRPGTVGRIRRPRRRDRARLVQELRAPVELLGQADATDVLRRSWAFALFARSEGTPLAVMEAMWAGRTVVGSPVPGIELLVGETGTIAGSVDAAADAFVRIASDRDWTTRQGLAAAERVRGLVGAVDAVGHDRAALFPLPREQRPREGSARARPLRPARRRGARRRYAGGRAHGARAHASSATRRTTPTSTRKASLASSAKAPTACGRGGPAGSVAALIAAERPDVVHVHNQFPSLSPSVYAAANAARIPVVQHLHNARLVCIQPFLVRDDAPCTSCVGRLPYPGVVHACYRGSRAQSAVVAAVQITHRGLGTWRRPRRPLRRRQRRAGRHDARQRSGSGRQARRVP